MAASLLTYLRWPLWVVELATGAKSFADNPLIGSRRLNGMGLHRLRVSVAHRVTTWRRWLLSGAVSVEDRAAFARQGFVEWRDVLPPEEFERMRAGIMERAWPAREMVQGYAYTRRIAVDRDMLRAVPELKALLHSPRWRGLMRYVAASSGQPHYYIQTILTHREGAQTEGADPQNTIHSDAFHPSMKAWLFLTDVAMEDGPLTYVAGSHRPSVERLDWEQRQSLRPQEDLDPMAARGSLRIEAEELGALGLPQPEGFAVPANTLVVADTFGFHARAAALRPSIRVELWAYSRHNPFLPWTGLHIGNLPGIVWRRVAMIWWMQDHFPRLAGLPLTPVGDKRPDEG
ncbi:phytanoyl-CoA dioxygenase family protein [soil metagenome]